MRRIFFLVSVLCIAMISCDRIDYNDLELGPSELSPVDTTKKPPYIIYDKNVSEESKTLTSEEAVNVVKMTDILYGHNTKSNTKEIDNVVSILNKSGDTLMYAVNYANENGYVLVSSSKNYYPILAQVDKGSFNDDAYNLGVSVLMEEYDYVISNASFLPEKVKSEINKSWTTYEKRINANSKSSRMNEFDAFITNTLQTWENDEDIHDYYNLMEAQNRLPSSLYSVFSSIAEVEANQNYDYLTYAYVVETVFRGSFNENNYRLQTIWNQGHPYNLSVNEFYENGKRLPTGCGAVALAQIMKYHSWPSTYDWSNMPNSLSWMTVNTETVLSVCLEDIANKIRKSQTGPINTSSVEAVKNALENKFNYKNTCTIVNHNATNIPNSLRDYGPVFMTGHSETGGHSWVCDGYGVSQRQMVYTLYVISPDTNLEYIPVGNPEYGEVISSGAYFHLNWGAGGDHNGWFLTPGNEIPVVDGYSERRIDIINIAPNR